MRRRPISQERESRKPFLKYSKKGYNPAEKSPYALREFRTGDSVMREKIKNKLRSKMRLKEDMTLIKEIGNELKEGKRKKAKKIFEGFQKGKVRLG